MGDERTTVRNLKVLKVDAENNFLVLSGAVPGGENALLLIRNKHPEFEKRLAASGMSAGDKSEEVKPAEGGE